MLGRPRSEWVVQLGGWATGGVIGVEVVKCLHPAEVSLRIAEAPTTAVVIDGCLANETIAAVVDECAVHRCPVVVVDETGAAGDSGKTARWARRGVAMVLEEPLRLGEVTRLISDLEDSGCGPDDVGNDSGGDGVRPRATAGLDATSVVRNARDVIRSPLVAASAGSSEPPGQVIGVIGAGGSGVSTLAAAVAQGIAHLPGHAGRVVLADLALEASQALYHDVGDVIPGIQELAEAHRRAQPGSRAVRRTTFAIDDRRYDLLLGLRRARDWAALRTGEVARALSSLSDAYAVVVCDLDSSLDGDPETGSLDVGERHAAARWAARHAQVVLVIGAPTMRGAQRMLRLADDLGHLGVDGERLVPVINRAPRTRRARSEITTTLARLAGPGNRFAGLGPVFIAERRGVESELRRSEQIHHSLVAPVTAATLAVLRETEPPVATEVAPRPVVSVAAP